MLYLFVSQTMEGKMQTLSLGNWMQLPNFPFKDWLDKHRYSFAILLSSIFFVLTCTVIIFC